MAPRYNIAPTQPVLVLPNDGTNKADFFVWGLIPSWAKDPAIGSRLINARAETLAEKPAFRSAYKYHRCLIFADGFFEWQAQPGTRQSKASASYPPEVRQAFRLCRLMGALAITGWIGDQVSHHHHDHAK